MAQKSSCYTCFVPGFVLAPIHPLQKILPNNDDFYESDKMCLQNHFLDRRVGFGKILFLFSKLKMRKKFIP